MPTFSIDAPNGKSYSIDGDNAEGALAALKKHIGSDTAPGPSLSDAVTDIPAEIGRTAGANIDAMKNLSGRGSKGSIEGLMDTGRAALAVPGLLMSPITGAARSLIGHPMAQAEHAVGTMINPAVAAKDNPQQMYQNAAGDVETALSGAMPGRASPVKVPSPPIADLKASATRVYDSPAIKSIDIPAPDAAALGAKIQNELARDGARPTTGNAPATLAEVNNLTPPPGVQSVKVDDLRSARRALNVAAGQRDPLTGAPTPDARYATQAIGHIDAFLDGLAPELKTANADYSAAKGAERLDYRMAKAEHRAARSGTGGNLENVMRQEADKISNRGLTAEEQAARDRIVMGSALRNTLRTTGKLGVDGGLSLMLHTGAALGTAGHTLPITVAGTAARKIGEMLTRREMGKLSDSIRSRSPLAQALQSAQPTPQISSQAKALAIALMAQPGRMPMIPRSIMPANAEQNQQ